ncbi:hypothetical protein M1B34_16730 [Pseudomonas sp. MAFF 302030]|uniref:Uncharacterized protein n=1 Tax=Pseudomonas morbosilactucae TaxID=2938197 RepID=A0A9X1YWA3_9PSED|nr:hypothetical protein [Pseudomonas morbosilactucae]MCK9799305.1 hypothetical protein [Pseudomonas morbosilactucae]
MAIYTIKQGLFSKVADGIEELLKARIVHWNSFGELFGGFRFVLHDEVPEVYETYRRLAFESGQQKIQSWMPAIQWVFVVSTSDDGVDLILIEDSLPDYLEALRQLQPLAQRAQQRADEGRVESGVRR